MSVELVAHRGASRERTENTMEAFQLALERGADAVELDVHQTSDGAVVVYHDFDVRGRPVARMSGEEVRAVALPGGGRIPLLRDVLEAVAERALVYIEIKGEGIEAAVLEEARRHGRRYAFHSFDHGAIERLAALAPDTRRGILLDRGLERAVEVMRAVASRTGARDVWPHWSLVNAEFTAAAHELGARVICWTVNSAELGRMLATHGVDALCTDDVRLLAGL